MGALDAESVVCLIVPVCVHGWVLAVSGRLIGSLVVSADGLWGFRMVFHSTVGIALSFGGADG